MTKNQVFFVFCPHTLTFSLNRQTVSHKKCEGRCEGKIFALTPIRTERIIRTGPNDRAGLNDLTSVWDV